MENGSRRCSKSERYCLRFGSSYSRCSMRPSMRVHESKPSKKFLKPSPAQWSSFNNECSNYSDSNSFILQPLCLNKFVEGVLRAAENNLESAPTGKKKKYTSRNTWAKIEQRNQLRRHGAPSQEVRRLNKIYKQARQDRQNIWWSSSMKTQMIRTRKVYGGKGFEEIFYPPICTDEKRMWKTCSHHREGAGHRWLLSVETLEQGP